jgi:hypothetical protein
MRYIPLERKMSNIIDEPIYKLDNTPPCARYNVGENNDRLIKVWIYVAGLIGGVVEANELARKVARLYDYKGFLVVATREKFPARVEVMFRKAWAEIGHEFEDHVEFNDVHSDRWELLWGSRQFESDRQP